MTDTEKFRLTRAFEIPLRPTGETIEKTTQFEADGYAAQVRAIRVWLDWAIGSTLLYLRSAEGARLEGQVLVVIRNRAGAIILATTPRMRWEKACPLPCSWATCKPQKGW